MLVPSVVLVPSFVLKPSPEIDFLSVFFYKLGASSKFFLNPSPEIDILSLVHLISFFCQPEHHQDLHPLGKLKYSFVWWVI